MQGAKSFYEGCYQTAKLKYGLKPLCTFCRSSKCWMTLEMCWNWLWWSGMWLKILQQCCSQSGRIVIYCKSCSSCPWQRNFNFLWYSTLSRDYHKSDFTGDCCLEPPSRSSWKKEQDNWQSLLIKFRPPKWICKDIINFYFFRFYII